MDVFEKTIEQLSKAQNSVEQYAVEVINENKEFILDLLREGQLAQGLSPDETPLAWDDGTMWGSGLYTEGTAKRARKEGTKRPKEEGAPYNFEWTGGTFGGMDLTVKGSEFEIFSRVWYFNTLLDQYGEVFHLSHFHISMLNSEVILPGIFEKMLNSVE